jgi:hypothetical protein
MRTSSSPDDPLDFDSLVEDRKGYRPPRGPRKALADGHAFEAIHPLAEARQADVDEKLKSHETWMRTSASPDDRLDFDSYRLPRGPRKALADSRAYAAIHSLAEARLGADVVWGRGGAC